METTDTREKIIAAAIDEFTEHGFEGARVARISKRAGVSQALIYYNFESKQAILDEIIDGFVKSNIEHIQTAYPENTNSLLDEDLRISLDFMLQKRKEIAILLMQTLVNTQDDYKVVSVFNEINDNIRNLRLNQLGYDTKQADGPNRKVIDYFYIFMPLIMYGILGEDWTKKNGITKEEAETAMIEGAKNIYNCFMK